MNPSDSAEAAAPPRPRGKPARFVSNPVEFRAKVLDRIGESGDVFRSHRQPDAVGKLRLVETAHGVHHLLARPPSGGVRPAPVVDRGQPVAGQTDSFQVADDPVDARIAEHAVGGQGGPQFQLQLPRLFAGIVERRRQNRPVHRWFAPTVIAHFQERHSLTGGVGGNEIDSAPGRLKGHEFRRGAASGRVAIGATKIARGSQKQSD